VVGLTGAVVLVVVVLASVLAPVVAPHDPLAQDLVARFRPPAWLAGGSTEYLLGTDQLGRDVLSRLLHAGRISLFIGLVTAVAAGVLGTLLGVLAAWYGRWAAAVLLRIVDIQIAFPSIVVAIAVIAVLGSSMTTLVLTLMVWVWVPFARVAYDSTLKIRSQEYIEAAMVSGTGTLATIRRHVLPNVAPQVLVIFTFSVAQVIVIESSLSFLGVGVQPPTPTWGGMVSQGRQNLEMAWWCVVVPALTIAAVVLSVNLLGDWLRDRLDPHHTERGTR